MHIVTLAGVDGSGKSTIMSSLSKEFPNALYVKEPHDAEIIEQIKQSDNVFKTIRLFVKDRIKLYEWIESQSPNIVISDRSMLCSMVYQSLDFPKSYPIESLHYIYKCNQDIPLPNQVIYIYANPDVVVKRLESRSDDDTLTQSQIKQIQDRYQLVFQLLDIKPLTIDTTYTTMSVNVSKIISMLSHVQ